jgi:twitching motility protein PilT
MHINELLKETMDAQASDLHLTAGRKPTIRVWGKLQPLEHREVLSPEDTSQLAYSMLNAFQKQKFEKTWELDLSYGVPGLGRFRVNLYRQRGATGIAMRSIPSMIPTVGRSCGILRGSREGWSWSPGRPDTARARPSPRCSTPSTRSGRCTS